MKTTRKLLLVGALLVVFGGYSQSKYDTLPNLPDHYNRRLEKFKKAKILTGRILFLGNSITEGGDWKKLLKDTTVINRGISGDNTFGVLQRVDEITKRKPSKVFLLIGVNDLSKDIPNNVVIENIFAILIKIRSGSPSTKIFVQSILPINPEIKGFPTRFSKQESIREINGQLKKYSEILKYTYVDIHSQFLDKRNLLDARFTTDGLHLNGTGYLLWVEYLKREKYL